MNVVLYSVQQHALRDTQEKQSHEYFTEVVSPF